MTPVINKQQEPRSMTPGKKHLIKAAAVSRFASSGKIDEAIEGAIELADKLEVAGLLEPSVNKAKPNPKRKRDK